MKKQPMNKGKKFGKPVTKETAEKLMKEGHITGLHFKDIEDKKKPIKLRVIAGGAV